MPVKQEEQPTTNHSNFNQIAMITTIIYQNNNGNMIITMIKILINRLINQPAIDNVDYTD
jgi:hypothetical protein